MTPSPALGTTPPRQRNAAEEGSRTPIIELLGPAGAGKTTVLRAIRRQDRRIRAGLRIGRIRFSLVLAGHALALVPMTVQLLLRQPRRCWDSMVHVLRLRTLSAVLTRELRTRPHAIVLDEGPLFSLTYLSVFVEAAQRTDRLGQEWRRALARWSEWLDVIIWLDAPDSVLIRRIRERGKAHRVKDQSDGEVARFLGRYREGFRDVLRSFRAAGHTRLLQIDTSARTAEEAAAALLATLPTPLTPNERTGDQ